MSHPTQNRALVIFILGSLATISPFAIDMYLPAFPQIAQGLHTSTAQISLSISSYFAGLAAGQLLYGPLLDRFGRRRPLFAGLLLYAAASLLCTQVHSSEWLIAMRFLQALGGCAAQVAGMTMVRDFFPAHETAKIISMLILILGVSPMLAPTVGGFVSVHLGWQWVFIILASVALLNMLAVFWYLPAAAGPDRSISLRPVPILRNFGAVLKDRQFTTFALASAFALSGLLVYVTGSSIVFMELFHVSAHTFGAIFAGLAVGSIGSNQINIWLLRKFSSEQIFRIALLVECPATLLLLVGTHYGWFGLASTVALLFVALTSVGFACPNAAALALVPFETNIGSAAAMMGFLQIAVSGLASASIGIFNSHSVLPVAMIFAATSCIALAIFLAGKRHLQEIRFVEEKGAAPLTR
jgi:DHA1 family bicyclomycin/chloramphenicol resistance-like MFS transporter